MWRAFRSPTAGTWCAGGPRIRHRRRRPSVASPRSRWRPRRCRSEALKPLTGPGQAVVYCRPGILMWRQLYIEALQPQGVELIERGIETGRIGLWLVPQVDCRALAGLRMTAPEPAATWRGERLCRCLVERQAQGAGRVVAMVLAGGAYAAVLAFQRLAAHSLQLAPAEHAAAEQARAVTGPQAGDAPLPA